MTDPEQADAQAAVESARTILAPDPSGADPHAGVRADGATIGREHARLEDPDGVGEHLYGGTGGGGADEVVLGCEPGAAVVVLVTIIDDKAPVRGGLRLLERQDGLLAALLEEEERGPAGGVADEVGRQPSVQSGDGLLGLHQAPEHGHGSERRWLLCEAWFR